MEKTDQSSIAVALCYLLAKQWYCRLDEYYFQAVLSLCFPRLILEKIWV